MSRIQWCKLHIFSGQLILVMDCLLFTDFCMVQQLLFKYHLWVVPFVLRQPGLEASHRQRSAFGMRTWTSIWSIKYIHIHMCIYVYLCRHIYLNIHINICCQNPHTLKLWETTFTLASLKQVRNESATAVKVKLDLCCESFVESCSNKHA